MLKRLFQQFLENKHGPLSKQVNWNRIYSILDDRCEELYVDKSIEVALRDENTERNRYSNVFPYDDNRVKLTDVENDYINASFIKYPDINTTYICSQGPLRETVQDFWLMIHQQNCKIVIMLNNLQEKGRDKCYKYYPDSDQQIINDVVITVKFKISHQVSKHITKRTLELHHIPSGSISEVLQYHFTSWPDFGVPDSPDDFLTLINEVNKSSHLDSSSPLVIHCSAGLGRTGTYCLTDCVLKKMKRSGAIHVDIFEELVSMRQFRFGLIQTSEQLYFAYISICAGMEAISMKGFHPPDSVAELMKPDRPESSGSSGLTRSPSADRSTPHSDRTTPERKSVDKSATSDKVPNKISYRKQVVKTSYRKSKSQSTSSVRDRGSPAAMRSRRTVSTNHTKRSTPQLKAVNPRNSKHRTKK